jgi:uroporphyrinogen-III decarboxylase
MPKGGLYFDPIFRQHPIDEDTLNVEDNLEEFGPFPNAELEHFKREALRLYTETDRAIILNLGMFSLGDIAKVPGAMLKDPKGIRSAAEWYMSLSARRDYVYQVFERQTAINLANLERIYQAVGNRTAVAYLTGADFGAQNGPLVAPKAYRELFLPFHKQINDWVHEHTTWKTFIHSCGSVFDLIEDFIAAGFDIMNPVQCSAAHMDPDELKRKFGERITFWGGGIDTQRTLPFGSTDDVRREVRERLKLFGPGGGFVFNAVHNIQAQVPVANVLAMYETALNCGRYPL